MGGYKATQRMGFFDAHLRLEQLREMEDPILSLVWADSAHSSAPLRDGAGEKA